MPKTPLKRQASATPAKASNKVVALSLEHALEVLSSGRKVKRLDLRLDYNGITSAGITRIAEALLKNVTLTHLYLCHNVIDDEGALHLAAALEENRSLVQFYLAGNRISTAGAEAILACIRRAGLTVDLDLSLQRVPDSLQQEIRLAALTNAKQASSTPEGAEDNAPFFT
ncbi:Nucleotide-binding oligomerization domain-containing protein 2 [Symbiodinium microadriaticum]|uniref:Nucleotide-binding oligomerization domain-containing protein 2 n=1 Tax=Symbiodinium microadriaticum TaxID=2951 RepID=A0A1Q9DXY9_SYMMI|nr:Nucleotide-binding oligomerization domain-containing protein 2 [Symbiodinium microadriaticum]